MIAREVLMQVQSNGARFLKRKEGDETKWEICEFNEALQKVCHGIRDTISTMGSKVHTFKKEFLEANAQEHDSRDDTAKETAESETKLGMGVHPLHLAMHGVTDQRLLAPLMTAGLVADEHLLHRSMARTAPLTPSELMILRNRQLRLLGQGL